jgi:hypothetical protein
VASSGVAVRSRILIDMHRSTDHPGLLVELVLPPLVLNPPDRSAEKR